MSRVSTRHAAWLGVALALAPCSSSCTSFDDAVASQGYFDVAASAALCARVFSCPGLAVALRRSIGAPIDGESFSTCMSWLVGPSPTPPGGFEGQATILARVSAASSCDDAAAGLDVVPIAAGDPLCADPTSAGCTSDGDLYDCAEGMIVRCPGTQFAAGSTCDPTAKRCVSPSTCQTPVDGLASCENGVLCADDVAPREQIVCASLGQACGSGTIDDAGPLHRTTIPVALCTNIDDPNPTVCGAGGNGATSCSAEGAMVICDHVKTETTASSTVIFAGVEIGFDCQGELGFSCVAPTSGSIPFCAPPGASCSPVDPGIDTCDGDTLAACVSGQGLQIDCTASGAHCHPGAAGGSASGGAYCAY